MFEVEVFEEKTISKYKKSLVKKQSKSKSYYDNENIKYFSKTEYVSLINNSNKYYRLIYLLLFETAARIEESRKLLYSDVDFDYNKIKISTSKQRKQNIYRVLVISDKLKALILQHKMENNLGDHDFILAKSPGKKPVIRQAIDKKLKYDCKNLNIDISKAHAHTWRHTRAITLLESGVDIIKVQKFLGHSSIQNTLIYLKYSNKEFEKAIQNANKFIGIK